MLFFFVQLLYCIALNCFCLINIDKSVPFFNVLKCRQKHVYFKVWFNCSVVFILNFCPQQIKSYWHRSVGGDLHPHQHRISHGCAVWVRLMCSPLTPYAQRADGPASSVQREQREMN